MRNYQFAALLAGAGAGIGATLLPALAPTSAERPDFDPLFAGVAYCTQAPPGRPVLLVSLLQAQQAPQQAYPTETRRFCTHLKLRPYRIVSTIFTTLKI